MCLCVYIFVFQVIQICVKNALKLCYKPYELGIFGGRSNTQSACSSLLLLSYNRLGLLLFLISCKFDSGSVLRSLVTSAKESFCLALSKLSVIIKEQAKFLGYRDTFSIKSILLKQRFYVSLTIL